jgi:hypothetical protein
MVEGEINILIRPMNLSALAFCFLVFFSSCVHAQISDFRQTDFKEADSIAALYPKHSLKDLRSLVGKLTRPLSTEEEKFRAIYKWVCDNIENDYSLYLRNKRKREKLKDPGELKEWNNKFSAVVFRYLLEQQKTVCTGYAYLVREMASHAGLSCKIIDGYGRTIQSNIGGPGIANHSWNAIQLNGKWYLCDATWSSGLIDTQESSFVKRFDDSYFLADPALFIRNHYPLDSTWMLLDIKPSLRKFLDRPIIYSTIYRYEINQLFPDTFETTAVKGQTFSFQFAKSNELPITKAELSIRGPKMANSTYPEVYRNATGLYCIDHIFSGKGTHTVHILLNDSYVVTYTVKVGETR